MYSMPLPKIIEGGIHVDARGQLKYMEKFPRNEIKRFYIISNNKQDFVRAWHGHKKEGKYVFALNGDFLIETNNLVRQYDTNILERQNINNFILISFWYHINFIIFPKYF